MNIIGTGLSGFVGSRIVELLSPAYKFENLSRKTGVDITHKEDLISRITGSSAEIMFHFAAYTDVDEAEYQRELGFDSQAWRINVNGTRNVVEACEKSGKTIIYISTDMVFSGTLPEGEKYSEEDERLPIGWYATTKYEAEKIVERAQTPWLIVRIAYPYRAYFEKKDYVRIFLSLLRQGKHIKAADDHFFSPTYIDDIANVLDYLICQKQKGKFNVVGSQVVSPYLAAMLIAQVWNLDQNLIEKTTREELFKQRAPRAFNLALSNAKISKLGLKTKSFEEGLQIINNQL